MKIYTLVLLAFVSACLAGCNDAAPPGASAGKKGADGETKQQAAKPAKPGTPRVDPAVLQAQRDAAARLESLGGKVQFDRQGFVTRVDLTKS